ncbi:MAG TPA: IS110 family transposase [Propionibacteriaceae bacterium]|nr:IS110 family transposase [Propionibacteriaceae bacterium]
MPNARTESKPSLSVVGGVDTHADSHTVAVLDQVGRRLGCAVFPADRAGYRALADWLAGYGRISAVGVEGTGSYGAGLTRWLSAQQITVVEVNRPNRADRRRRGKSDPVDAEQAAAAVLARTATTIPKARTGLVESIRLIHGTRAGAVKARTAARNTFINTVRTSPDTVREALQPLTWARQLKAAIGYRPEGDSPLATVKRCLRRLAVRITELTSEITAADADLDRLTRQLAPRMRSRLGFGPETTAQLLITAGDNLDRIGSEAALAGLCGVSPVQACSGKSRYYRLNRGGDRQANRALHMIILSRLRHHQPTRAYLAGHSIDGKATPHLRRVLKRYLVREVYQLLHQPQP